MAKIFDGKIITFGFGAIVSLVSAFILLVALAMFFMSIPGFAGLVVTLLTPILGDEVLGAIAGISGFSLIMGSMFLGTLGTFGLMFGMSMMGIKPVVFAKSASKATEITTEAVGDVGGDLVG
jgi:hypothetical protein